MNKMKNTIMLIVLLLISVQVNAWDESKNAKNTNAKNTNVKTNSVVTTVDEYKENLKLFREEFKNELLKWDFARIDQKIKGYEWDIEYISSEKWSQYAHNLDIYKTKLKALKQLREEYISYYKEVKTTVVNSTKEQSLEKEKILKAMEEKKQKELLDAKQKVENLKEKTTEVKEKVKEKAFEQTKKLSNIELLKQKKSEVISKHKEQFSKRLEKIIENLNTTQLEKALARVNEMIEKNSSKEVVLVQLIALKELIEEKISLTQELDLESIFKWL